MCTSTGSRWPAARPCPRPYCQRQVDSGTPPPGRSTRSRVRPPRSARGRGRLPKRVTKVDSTKWLRHKRGKRRGANGSLSISGPEICSGSSTQTVWVKNNLVCREICGSRPWSGTNKRRKLCNGHSHRVRVLVPERSRRRRDGGTGVDADADGHQRPDSSADGSHGGYPAHDTLLPAIVWMAQAHADT